VFKAVDAIPAMSELENMLHASTNAYNQYEVRVAGGDGGVPLDATGPAP
jgi:hypothetical protein